MLGVIVGDVVGAYIPVEMELPLRLTAPWPVGAEAEHFDAPANDGIIGDSNHCGVVSLDGC